MPNSTPKIYTRGEHTISRQNIAKNALTVLYGLHKAGFRALLVGGCIRDLLLGKQPKDFDVATDATPEEVKRVFRNCRLIGRRFRLAHVHFGREIIEVATFRADETGETDEEGRVLNHNTFGTIETDVMRRDFTLNALYYDIADFSIIDYVGAMDDINDSVIRMIGNPSDRYAEDPVRMLRAARFAAKLGMRIDAEAEQAISHKKQLLANVPTARLFDETVKLFLSGHAQASYEELRMLDLAGELFPQTDAIMRQFDDPFYAKNSKLIKQALKNTDYRINHNEPVTIAFLYAVLLWPVYRGISDKLLAKGTHWNEAMHDAIDQAFSLAAERVGIPMRHKTMVREMWVMQTRLTSKLNKRRMTSVLEHKRFRAGFDFLELRLLSGEKDLQETYDFWVQTQIDMADVILEAETQRQAKRKSYNSYSNNDSDSESNEGAEPKKRQRKRRSR